MTPRIALAPRPSPSLEGAVVDGGGQVVPLDQQPDALVWTVGGDWQDLTATLEQAPSARWVQLPFAGVEAVQEALTPDRTWTCAKGVYSEPVAEHALALGLAGLRSLPQRARARSWGEQAASTLYDADVVVLGGGGITTALLTLLAPFRVRTTVVRRQPEPLVGAARTVGLDRLDEVLPDALLVVLALALTPQTEHVVGSRQLELMREDAWLVNVARGRHVDTDALVAALRSGSIGGAALDVTDPEPLPDGHPLFELALVTPHTGNPWQTAQPLLAARVRENVERFAEGRDLLGQVDVGAGY